MGFWTNPWTITIGSGLVVAGVSLSIGYVIGKRRSPTAQEFAKARLDEEERRQDEMSNVACQAHEFLNELYVTIEGHREAAIHDQMLPGGFEDTLLPLKERWKRLQGDIGVLRRDDIAHGIENVLAEISRAYLRLATAMGHVRAIPIEGIRHDHNNPQVGEAQNAAAALINPAWRLRGLRDEVAKYRTRLGAKP